MYVRDSAPRTAALAMTSPIHHALLLTAGLGTRLRPLTHVRAKPALPLVGEALAARITRWLAAHGVTDLVLNLHYLPETITRELGDGSQYNVRLRYSWEQPILGSAGGPRLAAPIVGADPFLIVNGDTLTDVNLDALVAAHAVSGALVTMALVPNPRPDHYGGVKLDEDGGVTGFAPRGPSATGTFHFIGVQVAAAAAFDAIAPGDVASSVGGVYDRLIAERPGSVRGFVSSSGFWDIGTVGDYWRTSVEFAEGRDRLGLGRDVEIAWDARVDRSIVWDRVHVGAGAELVECIVTDDVHVPAGAKYVRSVLRAEASETGGVVATPFDFAIP